MHFKNSTKEENPGQSAPGHTYTSSESLTATPQKIEETKHLLFTAKGKDARSVKIKSKHNVKFKVQCSRHLYTLLTADKEKAEKLSSACPQVWR